MLLRVAVLSGLSGGFGRLVSRGVRAYARGRPWALAFYQPDKEGFDQLHVFQPAGVVTEVWQGMRPVVRAWAGRVPVVDLSDVIAELPSVAVASVEAAQLACRHLLGRGLKQVAYVQLIGEPFACRRREGYEMEMAARGLPPLVFDGRRRRRRGMDAADNLNQSLSQWLRALPKPAGVIADNDGRALHIMEVARDADIAVPERLAVIGIDNDEHLCELAQPPLTSVEQPAERIGFEAARVLDALLCGQTPPQHRLLLPPVRVVERQSTEIMAIADRDLAATVRYIRDHAHEPIGVEQVLRHVPISRRALERRFKSMLGHTVLDAIHLARLEQAKHCLASTDLSLPEIARRCGFSHVRRMGESFRKYEGIPPAQWRRRQRIG